MEQNPTVSFPRIDLLLEGLFILVSQSHFGLSCSVTLEKKGNLFWEDHFSGAATKKKGKRGH